MGVTVQACIGVGSNLGEPAAQVRDAYVALADMESTEVLATSGLYGSEPMGPADQPDYVNGAALVETRLSAPALLAAMLEAERAVGRIRNGLRWGPRILDLDLLVYGQEQIDLPDLTVPHPGIAERLFVLAPLHEIAPDLEIPSLGLVHELLAKCPPMRLARLD